MFNSNLRDAMIDICRGEPVGTYIGPDATTSLMDGRPSAT